MLTTFPPRKSMPRLNPQKMIARMPGMMTASEPRKNQLRFLTMSNRPPRRMIDELLVDLRVQARVAADPPAQHPREQRARDGDRGEERDDDADGERDRESADDVGAEEREDRAGDQRRDVAVTNGRKCAAEAGLDGDGRASPVP